MRKKWRVPQAALQLEAIKKISAKQALRNPNSTDSVGYSIISEASTKHRFLWLMENRY